MKRPKKLTPQALDNAQSWLIDMADEDNKDDMRASATLHACIQAAVRLHEVEKILRGEIGETWYKDW